MGSCCAKPITRIVKVGNSEAGIRGLESILTNARASGKTGEEELKLELLALARECGNYIAPTMEEDYKNAFLREFRIFCGERK